MNANTDRYPPQAPPPPANLKKDDLVEVHGLINAKELNGKIGCVVHPPKDGRAGIRLIISSRSKISRSTYISDPSLTYLAWASDRRMVGACRCELTTERARLVTNGRCENIKCVGSALTSLHLCAFSGAFDLHNSRM